MTGSAALSAATKQVSFAAFALDVGAGRFQPALNRRQIEQLFATDAENAVAIPGWEAYFVESIVEFIVHGHRPTGVISGEDAQWLVAQIGESPSPSVPALLRSLIAEARNVPVVLIGYALACGAIQGAPSP